MTSRAWLPWVVLGLYLAVCASAAVYEERGGRAPVLCLFRAATGRPCPTCGATRATLALARGHVAEALRLNPLIAAAWLLSPLLAAAVFAWRRRRPALDGRTRARLGWAGVLLLAAALAANWLYLLGHLR